MQDLETKIADYLNQCRELVHLTSQGGWMETGSITFEIKSLRSRSVIIAVCFTEIMREEPDRCTEQIDRFGQLELELNEFGDVVKATVL